VIGLPQFIKRGISIGRSLLSAALSPARQKQPEIKLLIQAAESGDGTTMEAQLAAGADVNSATESGMTILMSADANGHLGIVSLLLERGANVNVKRNDGLTALALAAFFGHQTCSRATWPWRGYRSKKS